MTLLDYIFVNVIFFCFVFLINSDERISICGTLPFNYALYGFQIMLHVKIHSVW